jgi:acyl-CoA hydrolase/GNAT superfamily N-acetyltransferase
VKQRIDESWQGKYETLLASAEAAVSLVRSGQRVFLGTGCAQPQALVDALLGRAEELSDVEIVHLLTLSDPLYRHHELARHFRLNRFFLMEGGCGRPEGLRDYIPIALSDIPRLFISGRLPIDVALIQVTPPEGDGMCSLGVSVDITKSAVENAGLVVAEVNPNMPWTLGDSLVSVHDLDRMVASDRPLLEHTVVPPTAAEQQIGEYVAALVSDGDTLEVGTCSVSLAVLGSLKDKRDLGLHTPVLQDPVVDLVQSGVLTGIRKNVDRGRVVASMALGTHRLFEFVDNNPAFCFRPAQDVSDPRLVSEQHNLIAVSTAVEVDLTGQVCACSAEGGFSGMGSESDLVHGVAWAQRGRLVIAMESTRQQGACSRVVPCLSRGAGVVATRDEVHFVVTEYGVAYLHGKTLQERALALLSIAHPQFRAGLLRAAIDEGYVSSDLAAVEGKMGVGLPRHRSSMALDDGTLIAFRPMHPTDERPVRELFYAVSKQTLFYRFMTHVGRVPRKQIQDFVYVDYRSEMAIVGTLQEAHGEDIVAVGWYCLNPLTNRAEVALLVRDQWQNRGIGKFLLQFLITLAKRNGITGFTADVLIQNRPMLAVFQKSGCRISSHGEEGVYTLTLDFD